MSFAPTKIPFIQSRASWQLILTSVIIVAVGAWLTVSPLANALGFVPLPPMYWLYMVIMLLGYSIGTDDRTIERNTLGKHTALLPMKPSVTKTSFDARMMIAKQNEMMQVIQT